MPTLASYYIFTGCIITTVVLSEPALVALLINLQHLQDLNSRLDSILGEN